MASNLASRRARERRLAAEAKDDVDAMTAALLDVSRHPVIEFGEASAVDFSAMPLKVDADRRPFWVTPTGAVFLEGSCYRSLKRVIR